MRIAPPHIARRRWRGLAAATALVSLGGCRAVFGLEPPASSVDARVADGLAADGVASDGAPLDARSLAACDPSDPDLIACYDFEGSVADLSTYAHPTLGLNVTYVAGQHGQAVHVDAAARITIADSAAFDIAQMTLQAWIRLDQVPSAGRVGVIDIDAQYGLFVLPGGVVRCFVPTPSVAMTSGVIQPDRWTHVACSYGAGTGRIYVDGVEQFSGAGGGSLPTSSTTGGELAGNVPTGDRMLGDLDLVRIYRIVRSAQQICADAGTAC